MASEIPPSEHVIVLSMSFSRSAPEPEGNRWVAEASVEKLVAMRLGPGESVVTAVSEEFDRSGLRGLTLISAVASFSSVQFGVAALDESGRPARSAVIDRVGAIEVTSLQGQIGRDETGSVSVHLHGSFAFEDGTIGGGHIFEAQVLATAEMLLISGKGLAWSAGPISVDSSHCDPSLVVFTPQSH